MKRFVLGLAVAAGLGLSAVPANADVRVAIGLPGIYLAPPVYYRPAHPYYEGRPYGYWVRPYHRLYYGYRYAPVPYGVRFCGR